jgi:DNA-binding response OmpR family regulator
MMARCACGRRRVLVVDDDADIRESLAMLLAEEGYEVAKAADGASALRHLRRDHACLVLLDLMMPGISGWKFMALMLEDANLAAIPVCIISAVDTHAPLHSVGVLAKPLDLEHVLTLVERYCPTSGSSGPHFAAV